MSFTPWRTCSVCNGAGKISDDADGPNRPAFVTCERCNGSGTVEDRPPSAKAEPGDLSCNWRGGECDQKVTHIFLSCPKHAAKHIEAERMGQPKDEALDLLRELRANLAPEWVGHARGLCDEHGHTWDCRVDRLLTGGAKTQWEAEIAAAQRKTGAAIDEAKYGTANPTVTRVTAADVAGFEVGLSESYPVPGARSGSVTVTSIGTPSHVEELARLRCLVGRAADLLERFMPDCAGERAIQVCTMRDASVGKWDDGEWEGVDLDDERAVPVTAVKRLADAKLPIVGVTPEPLEYRARDMVQYEIRERVADAKDEYRRGVEAAAEVVSTWCNDPVVLARVNDLLDGGEK